MTTSVVNPDLRQEDVRELIIHAIDRCNDARELLLNVSTAGDRASSPPGDGKSDSDDVQARKRRAAAAANRRHKIMAQMSQMQSKFAKDHADLLDKMDTTPTPSSAESSSTFFSDQGLPVAVGPKRTNPIINDANK